MQFVCIPRIGPGVGAHFGNRFRRQCSDFAGHLRRQNTSHLHRARAALFQRCIVQVRVGIRIQDLVRELRRNRRINCQRPDCAGFDLAQHALEAFQIHGLLQHVFHDLADERMLGNLQVAFNVLLASGDLRED